MVCRSISSSKCTSSECFGSGKSSPECAFLHDAATRTSSPAYIIKLCAVLCCCCAVLLLCCAAAVLCCCCAVLLLSVVL
jgi:hypothetical protein